MCPCKRATGPAALQSRHLPRVEGVGFTGRKQATIRGVGFHFPRAFFSRYSLSTLSPRLSTGARARVSSVFSSLSLSRARASLHPPADTSEAARCSAHFRRFVGHEGPRANYKNTETSGGRRLERALESAVPARSRTKRAAR